MEMFFSFPSTGYLQFTRAVNSWMFYLPGYISMLADKRREVKEVCDSAFQLSSLDDVFRDARVSEEVTLNSILIVKYA